MRIVVLLHSNPTADTVSFHSLIFRTTMWNTFEVIYRVRFCFLSVQFLCSMLFCCIAHISTGFHRRCHMFKSSSSSSRWSGPLAKNIELIPKGKNVNVLWSRCEIIRQSFVPKVERHSAAKSIDRRRRRRWWWSVCCWCWLTGVRWWWNQKGKRQQLLRIEFCIKIYKRNDNNNNNKWTGGWISWKVFHFFFLLYFTLKRDDEESLTIDLAPYGNVYMSDCS